MFSVCVFLGGEQSSFHSSGCSRSIIEIHLVPHSLGRDSSGLGSDPGLKFYYFPGPGSGPGPKKYGPEGPYWSIVIANGNNDSIHINNITKTIDKSEEK